MYLKRNKTKLEELNQETCWALILNESISLNKTYLNPTRIDKKPGCKFTVRDGNLVLMDFARKTGLNCAQAYSKIYGLSFQESLEELFQKTQNVKFSFQESKINYSQAVYQIEIEPKPFNQEFLDYWKMFGMDESDLEGVYQPLWYKITNEDYSVKYYPRDLVIAYKGNEGYKLYFPNRDKPRFKSSLRESDVWTYVRNPKKWIIAKAHKDFLFIKHLTKDTDWSVGMVQSEGSVPQFIKWESADKIKVLFDNDEAGQVASIKFRKHYTNARAIFIPQESGEKDLTDFCITYGYEYAKELLLEML